MEDFEDPQLFGEHIEWGWPACTSESGRALEQLLRESGPPGALAGTGFTEVDFDDFDQQLQLEVEKLKESTATLSSSLEGLLTQELLARLRADLLYLVVTRKYAAAAIPGLPSFDATTNRTWTLCGASPQWLTLAKQNAVKTYLRPLDVGQRLTARQTVASPEVIAFMLDAYLEREVCGFRGVRPAEGLPYALILRKLKLMIRQVMMDVGGACGLPDRNRTSDDAPAMLSPLASIMSGEKASTPEEMKDVLLLGVILENTRAGQADLYLGHVLFGLCLRRLGRRFALQQRAGLLPPLPESVQQRLNLERAAAGGDAVLQQQYETAAQFEIFVESVISADKGQALLQSVLELSPALLAAIRRHTDAIFGRGLREESFRPIEAASKASAQMGREVTTPEVCSAFLLEAASSGELRMLSAGPEAKERMAWDGLLFGALLQDAEDVVAATEVM